MSFKPIDPKRDEFRRYLERNGVIESLTKLFVRIVRDRPENPLEYLRQNLGDTRQENDTLSFLQTELNEARNEVKHLRGIIQSVNPQILEEIDKEKITQPQQIVNVVANGNESAADDAVATTITAATAHIIENNDESEKTAANESSETQLTEGQQDKMKEQAINATTNEHDPSKVAQNNVSNTDKVME